MKQHRLILAAAIIIIFMVSCSLNESQEKTKESEENNLNVYNETVEFVKDINQNSDFYGLELLAFSTLTEDQVKNYGPDYPEMAFTGTTQISGYYFEYPWESGNRRLTQIRMSVAPYHVYGITVGQGISDTIPILEDRGFTELKNESLREDTNRIVYQKYHVCIMFDVNKETKLISAICVAVYDKTDEESGPVY